jgi:hypothetical protein
VTRAWRSRRYASLLDTRVRGQEAGPPPDSLPREPLSRPIVNRPVPTPPKLLLIKTTRSLVQLQAAPRIMGQMAGPSSPPTREKTMTSRTKSAGSRELVRGTGKTAPELRLISAVRETREGEPMFAAKSRTS